MKTTRAALCLGIALLMCCARPSQAAPAAPERAVPLKALDNMPVKEITIFKGGLAFVPCEGDMPTDETWAYPPKLRLFHLILFAPMGFHPQSVRDENNVYTNSSPSTSYINENGENGQSGLLLAEKPPKPRRKDPELCGRTWKNYKTGSSYPAVFYSALLILKSAHWGKPIADPVYSLLLAKAGRWEKDQKRNTA